VNTVVGLWRRLAMQRPKCGVNRSVNVGEYHIDVLYNILQGEWSARPVVLQDAWPQDSFLTICILSCDRQGTHVCKWTLLMPWGHVHMEHNHALPVAPVPTDRAMPRCPKIDHVDAPLHPHPSLPPQHFPCSACLSTNSNTLQSHSFSKVGSTRDKRACTGDHNVSCHKIGKNPSESLSRSLRQDSNLCSCTSEHRLPGAYRHL
jgi:hypothetical protein